jgi:hypothetical protein
VIRGARCQHRRLTAATIAGERAARSVAAARLRVDHDGRLGRSRLARPSARELGVGLQDGREQRLRVGMAGRVVDRIPAADLDDTARIHDPDPVRDMADDREIMRDEQVGEAELALQILEQVDDLGADRNIERRDRLVGNDELGRDGERAGDADALPLPTREGVRRA